MNTKRFVALAIAAVMFTVAWADDPGQSDRAPIQLTDEARQFHESCLLVDGHNDLPWEIRTQGSSDFSTLDIAKSQPSLQTDIPRLRKGGMGAQFWSVWVPVDFGYQGTALGTTIEQIKLVRSMIDRYPNDFELALSTEDIRRIQESGKIASLIGVEGGHCIEESLGNLRNLYNLGARYMTLTHADSLSWADSATDEPKVGGLSPFGVSVVETMNDLGMMVDISHVTPETMHAALDASRVPVIFSHSSARAVADSPRNVPDDVLRRLREKDGVVMVNFFSAFIVPDAVKAYHDGLAYRKTLGDDLNEAQKKRLYERFKRDHPLPRGTIHDLLDHIDHIVKVAGWEHVGIGSDYDGVSVLPEGLEDVSCYPFITQGLIDRGYNEQQIRGILGENLMRVMEKVEKAKLPKSE